MNRPSTFGPLFPPTSRFIPDNRAGRRAVEAMSRRDERRENKARHDRARRRPRAEAPEQLLHDFDSKGVPPLAVLVSGGTLNKSAGQKIAPFIESKLKGRAHYHSVLVVEAVPSTSSGADEAARKTDARGRDARGTEVLQVSEEQMQQCVTPHGTPG
jgi:hypothetical protein